MVARTAQQSSWIFRGHHLSMYPSPSSLPDQHLSQWAMPPTKKNPRVVSTDCLPSLYEEIGVEGKYHPSCGAPGKNLSSALDPRPPSFNTCHEKD